MTIAQTRRAPRPDSTSLYSSELSRRAQSALVARFGVIVEPDETFAQALAVALDSGVIGLDTLLDACVDAALRNHEEIRYQNRIRPREPQFTDEEIVYADCPADVGDAEEHDRIASLLAAGEPPRP